MKTDEKRHLLCQIDLLSGEGNELNHEISRSGIKANACQLTKTPLLRVFYCYNQNFIVKS